MQNNYGVKKRFLACFLKILDKKRKKWRQVLSDQYPLKKYLQKFGAPCFCCCFFYFRHSKETTRNEYKMSNNVVNQSIKITKLFMLMFM